MKLGFALFVTDSGYYCIKFQLFIFFFVHNQYNVRVTFITTQSDNTSRKNTEQHRQKKGSTPNEKSCINTTDGFKKEINVAL